MARWHDLVRSAKHPMNPFLYELRQMQAAGVHLSKGGTIEGDLAAAVEKGVLTEHEAAYWRIRAGLPDPETAPRARQSG